MMIDILGGDAMAVIIEIDASANAPARGRLRAALVAVAVVAAIAGFVQWRDALAEFSGSGAPTFATGVAPGSTVYFGAFVDPETPGVSVDVHALTPIVTDNSARATVRVLLCAGSGATGRGGIGVATSIGPYCDSATPFRAGTHRLGETAPSYDRPVQSVIIAIAPSRPGRVHVAGLHIRYSEGIRNGDQIVGVPADVTTG